MQVFGKRFSEYLELAKPILLLIVVVGVLRLGLSLAASTSRLPAG
jgi:hypothetical protein